MKYQQSKWMKGLLFAEQQSKDGWKIDSFHPCDQWFAWECQGAKQTVYGECEWLDGVLDYYKHQAHNVNVLFEGWAVEDLGTEFAQMVEDNFWEIVLK